MHVYEWMDGMWMDGQTDDCMDDAFMYGLITVCLNVLMDGWKFVYLSHHVLKKNQGGRTLHFPENMSNCNPPNPGTLCSWCTKDQ